MIVRHRFRIPTDTRGRIKSGLKNAKGFPQALDYFNISKFPELVKAYGEKPSVLVVCFPSDRITDFYDSNYELWKRKKEGNKGVLIRSCDGASCVFRTDQTVNGDKVKAGTVGNCACEAMKLSSDDKEHCKYVCRFSAWIVMPQTGRPENPLCYRFEAGYNSGENVLSGLEFIKPLSEGRIIGIPFYLSVTMVESRKEIGKKFPVWSLRPVGMMSQIQKSLPSRGSSLMLPETLAVEEKPIDEMVVRWKEKIAVCASRDSLVRLYREIQGDKRLDTGQWEDLEKEMKTKAETFPVKP